MQINKFLHPVINSIFSKLTSANQQNSVVEYPIKSKELIKQNVRARSSNSMKCRVNEFFLIF